MPQRDPGNGVLLHKQARGTLARHDGGTVSPDIRTAMPADAVEAEQQLHALDPRFTLVKCARVDGSMFWRVDLVDDDGNVRHIHQQDELDGIVDAVARLYPEHPDHQPFDSDEYNRMMVARTERMNRALTGAITLRNAKIIDSTITHTISSSGAARDASHQRRPAGRRPARRSRRGSPRPSDDPDELDGRLRRGGGR